MAATLADSAALAVTTTFQARVQAAMVTAAIAVAQETSDLSLDYYRLRRALATRVLMDPQDWAAQFAWAAAVNPVITDASSDGDIQYTVNSVWPSIAGAGPVPTS